MDRSQLLSNPQSPAKVLQDLQVVASRLGPTAASACQVLSDLTAKIVAEFPEEASTDTLAQVDDMMAREFEVPSERDQIVFFNCLNLYHTTLDSGGRQYTSRT